MVVLCIDFEHRFAKGQLTITVAQPFDDGAAVVPDLIVLRVLFAKAVKVVQLLIQIKLELFQTISAIQPVHYDEDTLIRYRNAIAYMTCDFLVPYCIVSGIQLKKFLYQLKNTLAVFFLLLDRPKQVHEICD